MPWRCQSGSTAIGARPIPTTRRRCALDDHRRKEDMTDDRVCHRDEGQRVAAGRPQLLDEVSLRRLPERELVEASNG